MAWKCSLTKNQLCGDCGDGIEVYGDRFGSMGVISVSVEAGRHGAGEFDVNMPHIDTVTCRRIMCRLWREPSATLPLHNDSQPNV